VKKSRVKQPRKLHFISYWCMPKIIENDLKISLCYLKSLLNKFFYFNVKIISFDLKINCTEIG